MVNGLDFSGSESSSDDDFVLELLQGEKEKRTDGVSTTRSSSNKRKRAKLNIQRSGSEANITDDFEIKLPKIFLDEAKKNEEIARRGAVLREELAKEDIKTKSEQQSALMSKQAIADELNDNGTTENPYSLHDLSIEKFIEELLEDESTCTQKLPRLFYFFLTTRREHALDTDMGLPVDNDTLLFFLTSESYPKLYSFVSRFLRQLVNYVLVDISDMRTLFSFCKFMDFVREKRRDSKLVEAHLSEFEKAIWFLGGDIEYINKRKILIRKLVHFNETERGLVFKLCILYKYFFICTSPSHEGGESFRTMVQVFFLTLLDFNLAHFHRNELIKSFIRPVLSGFIQWKFEFFRDTFKDDIDCNKLLACEMHYVLRKICWLCEYPDYKQNTNLLGQYDSQLHYFVLLLLRISVALNEAIDSKEVDLVNLLCLASICDEEKVDQFFALKNRDINIQFVFFSILKTILGTNYHRAVVLAEGTKFDKHYYNLSLLNSLLLSQDLYSVIQPDVQLKMQLELDKSKNYLHDQLRLISHLPSLENNSRYKKEVVNLICRCYKLLSDVLLSFKLFTQPQVPKDLFYSDPENVP